jgi:hypothetical protein
MRVEDEDWTIIRKGRRPRIAPVAVGCWARAGLNEAECQEASKRLGDELKRLGERARLKEAGLGDVEIRDRGDGARHACVCSQRH